MEEQINFDGMALHTGMTVRLIDTGKQGRVESIRLLSTGETINEYQLHDPMEPLVLTLTGQGYVTKQLVDSPSVIQTNTLISERHIDDDLNLADEKEAIDNEAVFGDGGDDGNPLQDMMDDMELGSEGDGSGDW